MPKIVDHEQRRRDIAAALWRIVDRDGMSAVNIRSIAREAGLPRATAAYYFDGQIDLLTFAMSESVQRSSAKIRRLDLEHGGVDVFTEAFVELVPTTPKRRRQSTIWLTVVAAAISDDKAAAALAEWNVTVRDGIRELLTIMRDRKLLAKGVDIDAEADSLHAIIDGLALHTLTDSKLMPAGRIKAQLSRHMATITK